MSSKLTEASHDRNASQPLFRREVMAGHQTQWLGTVLLTPPLSHRFFALFAACAIAAILGLLFFKDYTRTALVGGWLVPEGGLARVFAPQPGVITELHVIEGSRVREGEPLVTLSAELQSATLGATQAEIVRELTGQRDSLIRERQRHERLVAQQTQTLTDRLMILRTEHEQIEQEIALQRSRLGLAHQVFERFRKLRGRDYVSDQQLQKAHSDELDQKLRLRALERSRIVAERERLALVSQLRNLPLKSQARIASIERNISTVEQQLAAAEAQREIVIPAPHDGTVTAVQAELGGRADLSVPLMSIVPRGAQLQAHLYSPSRSVGFVHRGQRVFLRYDAYPYQKFGHYGGVVAEVFRSPINARDLPSQLGSTIGEGAGEGLYRITVRLAKQSVNAYGRAVSLQPGMQLEANIKIENRRLYEWVLDPLYTITGKWQG